MNQAAINITASDRSAPQAAVDAARKFRPITLFQSALFIILFLVSVALVGIGGLFAFSRDDEQALRALPILFINFALIFTLAAYLSYRVWTTLFSGKTGDPAPQLYRRFLAIFSLAAIMPAVVVGTFFGAVMSRDISDLLNTNVQQVMSESRVVSGAYLKRELDLFQPDVRALAATLNQSAEQFQNRISFSDFLISQAVFWEFPAVYVINQRGEILAKAESPSAPAYRAPSPEIWEVARDSKNPLTVGNRSEIDFLSALINLDRFDDAYLYTGRYLEEGILSSLENMDRLEDTVTRVTGDRGAMNRIFLLTYLQAALLILIAAIWLGLVPLSEALPTFQPAFNDVRESVTGIVDDQINLNTPGGIRNFDLRVSGYRGDRSDTGWVMTFDDMTRLVAAQRHSAWREVARRIAHEIKNPLTPIQLSAERLERKYSKEIKTDPKTFKNLTQTITRQVESLGAMVDEFSGFARMPAPQFENVNIHGLLEETIFEQRVAFPDIQFFVTDNAPRDSLVNCDERLMSQALMNLIKNAGESVTARIDAGGDDLQDGRIDVLLEDSGKRIEISLVDNGIGWPMADKDRLFEPYVTTRESGTGLGLAIVKRVIEDHGGQLHLHDRVDGKPGAYVRLSMPKVNSNSPTTNPGVEADTL